MRPLIVDLGRDYRGGQDQALLLLRGLLTRGHAAELITLSGSLLERRAKDSGITVHGVPPGSRRLPAAWAIRRLVQGHRVDVIHANEPHALTAAWLAGAHRSVPVIVSRRIERPLSSSSFSIARYRAASRVVAVSHFVEKSLAGCGLPPDRIEVIFVGEVIPPAISQEDRERARSRFGLRPENQCLGNVAALVPEKGHVLFLRAFAELRAQFPQSVVLIAGDGPEQAHLQELVRQLHIEDAVKFPGFITDVESVYAATDVFVFPSHDEPLACAMLSAMARGLPVVAFARGGNPEAIQDAENGLLVKELDSHALASAIARLLLDPAEAQKLGKAARETVSTRFSADRMVDATLQLYEEVISD